MTDHKTLAIGLDRYLRTAQMAERRRDVLEALADDDVNPNSYAISRRSVPLSTLSFEISAISLASPS